MDLAGFFSSSFFFLPLLRVRTCNTDAGSCCFRRTYYVGAFLSVLPEQRSWGGKLGFSESWRYGAR